MWILPLPDWPAWLVVACGLVALYLLLNGIAWGAARRRTQDIRRALAGSTRGHLESQIKQRTGRIRAAIAPAPDPYRTFFVEFTIGRSGALSFLLWPAGLRRQSLTIRAALTRPPQAELKWQRGRPPDSALGRTPETALWRQRRIDFLREDFAVRGANTAAVEHAFADLQGRFGPFTRRVVLSRDAQPHLEVLVATQGLNSEEIPALILWCCAAGRASLHV